MSTRQQSAAKTANKPAKNKVVYYVDGKPVKVNLFDRVRIKMMSDYERQAFLAAKLLEQEKSERRRKK